MHSSRQLLLGRLLAAKAHLLRKEPQRANPVLQQARVQLLVVAPQTTSLRKRRSKKRLSTFLRR